MNLPKPVIGAKTTFGQLTFGDPFVRADVYDASQDDAVWLKSNAFDGTSSQYGMIHVPSGSIAYWPDSAEVYRVAYDVVSFLAAR